MLNTLRATAASHSVSQHLPLFASGTTTRMLTASCFARRFAYHHGCRVPHLYAMSKRSIDTYFQRLPDTTKKQKGQDVSKAAAVASDGLDVTTTAPAAAAPAGGGPAADAGPSSLLPSHPSAAVAAAAGGQQDAPTYVPHPRIDQHRRARSRSRSPLPAPVHPPPTQQQQQGAAHGTPPAPAPVDQASATPPATTPMTSPTPAAAAAAAVGGTPGEASASTPAAGDQQQQQQPSAATLLMANARSQAKAKAATAATAAPRQMPPEEMAQLAASNQAAVADVLSAAAAAGCQPQLRDLLVEPSWQQVLGPEFDKPYMASLQSFLHAEWSKGVTVFPPKEGIFRAFNSVPFDQVRVVVLGQDPYHQPGNAMGLSFSVPPGQPLPGSLRNIYKELGNDCGVTPSTSGDLTPWCRQGVLLLNAMLTVRSGAAGSHASKGWEAFTDAAIGALSARRNGVVFLLWGNFAKAKGARVDKARHHVLTSAHPSGLSASRGFFGCKHFSQANQLLQQSGQRAIDWRLS